MLTGSQMIAEALRRLVAGDDPETVLQDIFGPVLNAAAYAADKSRALSNGDDCDTDDLMRACDGCADVIAEEEYEEDEEDDDDWEDDEEEE